MKVVSGNCGETVETVFRFSPFLITGLKPGVNERQVSNL
jgi:hypothetical protein